MPSNPYTRVRNNLLSKRERKSRLVWDEFILKLTQQLTNKLIAIWYFWNLTPGPENVRSGKRLSLLSGNTFHRDCKVSVVAPTSRIFSLCSRLSTSQPVNWMMASGQHNYYWNPQSSTWSPQPLSWDPPSSGNLAPVSSWQQSSLSWSPSGQEEPQEERRGGGRQGRGGRRQDKEKNRMAVRSSRAKKRREEEEIRMEIPVYREENRKLENSILGMEAKLELLGQIVSAQDQATGGQFSNSPEGSQIANIINGMEKGN